MIKNITNNKILCTKSKKLTSIISKAFGLMFQKKIIDIGYIFYFKTPKNIDLHMFFVFFPIDVLFLDEDKQVIEIKENFKPFTLYFSKKIVSYVVELPHGIIDKSKTKINDTLEF
jgi:uncharacterized membrane protein (UPF0127 family)